MVDLDSNPTKLIEIVEVGKQLLITRGALTTFSIANDVAKYFAILPAIFAADLRRRRATDGPARRSSTSWRLGTPRLGDHLGDHLQRAGHPAAGPLALRGVRYRADRRHRAAAPQPADLRPRRPDRPVHRDQADRPGRPQPARGLSALERGAAMSRGRTRSSSAWPRASARPTGCCRRATPRPRPGATSSIGLPRDRTAAPRRPRQAEGLEVVPRRRVAYRGRRARGDGPAGDPRARARAGLIDELAHTNAPGRRAREALRGHRRRARRRHRRVLDRQRPAPRVAQRPGRRADRGARARDGARLGPRQRRRGRPDRPDARGADRRACAPARSTPARASRPRSTTSSGSRTSRRCARSRCARSPRTSSPSALACAEPGRSARARSAVARRRVRRRSASGCSRWSRRDPSSQRLVRRAWRSAQRLGAELDLLWVKPPGREPIEGELERQLTALRQLASVLGAHLLIEEGDDVAAVAARVVRERGTTYVLVGEPRRAARASRGCASRCRSG